MSAAISVPIAEPDQHETPVHEWLESVRDDAGAQPAVDAKSRTKGNSIVATTCAAAVDPLEIAANLEASGVSRQVATDRYGQSDVFALADQLWTMVPFRPITVRQEPMWRAGNARDLGRGVLYAAPAVILLALTRLLGVELSWWSLPLAITWGWALGQVVANAGYTLRSRRNSIGERVACGWLMVVTIVSTTAFAVTLAFVLGGGVASVVGAIGVTTYMVSSAILLMNDRDTLAEMLLVPAASISVVILVAGTDAVPAGIASVAILGSAIATFLVAAAYMRLGRKRSLRLLPGDARMLSHHLAHGLICGAALSLVAILGGHVFAGSGGTAFLAAPLLLTLGVMEWQLRTFRSRVERLANTQVSLDEFAPRSWRLFGRALLLYLGWTLLASVAIAVVVEVRHSSVPYALLAAQVALGTAFYVDLTLVSLARLNIVMRCWLQGLAVGVFCVLSSPMVGSADGSTVLWASAVIATVVALALMLAASHDVVSASMSH